MSRVTLTIYRRLSAPALLLVASASAWGCATSGTPPPLGRVPEAAAIVYPAPPDTARIQFLTAFTSAEDLTGPPQRSVFSSLTGEEGVDEGSDFVAKAYGVSFADGRIYVCDTARPGVVVMDVAARTFDRFTPLGGAALRQPLNCFADPSDGSLYVADGLRNEVLGFDRDRSLRFRVGAPEGGHFTDVFVRDGVAWIVNATGDVVEARRIPGGEVLATVPAAHVEAGNRPTHPVNLWVTENRVYVSDFGTSRVLIYDHAGDFVRAVGSYGDGLGQFARPRGVAVDREGILYAVDAAFENVQMFDEQGRLLLFFGGPYTGPGDMWLPAQISVHYEGIDAFQPLVAPGYRLEYVVLVANQFGPDRVSVYGRVILDTGPVTP